jgi:hypothetical protein
MPSNDITKPPGFGRVSWNIIRRGCRNRASTTANGPAIGVRSIAFDPSGVAPGYRVDVDDGISGGVDAAGVMGAGSEGFPGGVGFCSFMVFLVGCDLAITKKAKP